MQEKIQKTREILFWMYPLVHGYKTLQQQQYEASVDGGHKAPQNTGTMGGIICCEFGMQVPLEDEEEYPQGDAAARCRPGSATGPGSNASAARCPQAAFAPPSPQPQPQPLLVPARAPAMPLMRPLSPSLMQPLPPPPPPTPPPQPAPQAPRALVTAKPQVGGYHQHPLGSMFFPGLDKAGVLELVKEVLCKPGFVSGPSEEKRLLRSIRSGLVDIQTMSRLLRWLRGERAGRELRGRGLNFVGPETDDKVRPVTTGMGMSRLMKEVITRLLFVACAVKWHSAAVQHYTIYYAKYVRKYKVRFNIHNKHKVTLFFKTRLVTYTDHTDHHLPIMPVRVCIPGIMFTFHLLHHNQQIFQGQTCVHCTL